MSKPMVENILKSTIRKSYSCQKTRYTNSWDIYTLLVQIHKRRLEKCSYTVTVTTDSREALEIFRAHPDQFDLFLTDQTMPGLSGDDH